MIKEMHVGECGEHLGKKSCTDTATNGLLLAHHDERYSRICEKMPQLPSTSQLDSHLSTKLTQHGHPMALPHLRA